MQSHGGPQGTLAKAVSSDLVEMAHEEVSSQEVTHLMLAVRTPEEVPLLLEKGLTFQEDDRNHVPKVVEAKDDFLKKVSHHSEEALRLKDLGMIEILQNLDVPHLEINSKAEIEISAFNEEKEEASGKTLVLPKTESSSAK